MSKSEPELMYDKFSIDTISCTVGTSKAQNTNDNFTRRHRLHRRVEILYTLNVTDSSM